MTAVFPSFLGLPLIAIFHFILLSSERATISMAPHIIRPRYTAPNVQTLYVGHFGSA
jgi:hypothetical protein